MTVPASRSLEAVLRQALAPGNPLRIIVGTYTTPASTDPRYVTVEISGEPFSVPNLNGTPAPAAGSPAYVLADNTRMWTLGTVTDVAQSSGGGSAGPPGPTGPAGPTGATGTAGPQGLPGATGATGATGPQGAAGPTGATGAAGATGPSGASTFLSGTGAPTAGVGVAGSIYLDTASGRRWGAKGASAWPSTPLGRIMPTAPTYGQLTTG